MLLSKNELKNKRARRIRKNLKGTSLRPRLSVYLSSTHIYAQIIDDEKGSTLAGYGTRSKGAKFQKKSKDAAKYVGEKIAELAKAKNIDKIVYDRGGLKYHGLVAIIADSARDAGLKF